MTTSTDQTDAGCPSRAGRVAGLTGTWQHELSRLGGHNALLWFREPGELALDLTSAHPGGLAKLFSSGTAPLAELVRRPAALEEARAVTRQMAAVAERLYAGRSLTTCHLAYGLARWDMRGSARVPAAPVLLRRCDLGVDGGHSGAITLTLVGDLQVNGALLAYLASEHGLDIDQRRILEAAGGTDPSPAFARLDEICGDVPGWRIESRLLVGLFAPAKLGLLQDLPATAGDAAHHPVIAALAGDEESIDRVGATPPPTNTVPAEQERLALDADHDQQDAIEAVRAGAHLVLEGPPGTGKTQTAANLVAALAADGRRTLFVSHQRAAVEALARRLDSVDCADLLLDTHSTRANPTRLAAHLVDLLDQWLTGEVAAEPESARPELPDASRDRLQRHLETMHCVRAPWGVSLDEAQAHITHLEECTPAPRSRVRLNGADLAAISAHRRDELCASLREVAELEAWTSVGDPDPWFGARIIGAGQLERARDLVTRVAGGALAEHRRHLGRLCEQVGLPAPRTMRVAGEQLDLMRRVHATLETFRPEVFSAPVDDMVAATGTRDYRREHDARLGAVERRRLRRQAAALLRPGPPPRALHAVLERAAAQRTEWRAVAGPGALPSCPASAADLAEQHEQLRDELEWLGERLAATREGGGLLDTELDDLEDRLARLAAAPDRLAKVPKVIGVLDTLRANGLEEFIDDIAARQLDADQAVREFEFVWWASLLREAGGADTAYEEHDGGAVRDAASDFAIQDAAQIGRARAQVRRDVARRIQRAAADFPQQCEALREAAADGRALTTKDAIRLAPELLGVLTPCWAMGVFDVPDRVPPGMWFDVVICDEASQITPAEAAAAIVRGGQLVVLGDHQQLPPAALTLATPRDEATGGRDQDTSLLDALAPLLPVRTLRTHYRSIHERLIAFAGTQLYAGGLRTFPSAEEDGAVRLDVVSTPADGASTDPEIDHLVHLVSTHGRKHPDESLAVVTLTHEHARRVEEALRVARAADPQQFRGLRTDGPEAFCVRAVDQMQGEVRDAVIVSIGFARGADGRAPHRFGSLSATGGERRLGVAMSRARTRMVVVSSFSGGELDPSKLRSRGATMLRDFLLYAASGGAARRMGGPARGTASAPVRVGPHGRRRRMASTGSVLDRPTVAPDQSVDVSPLVADLARRMHAEGLVVHTAFGLGPRRIDLAVEDPRRPGVLMTAVETDGSAYGSVTAARDRDRLWVEQLRRRGWQHERVWTRDLFRDPAQEVARLVSAVYAESNRRRAARG